MTSAARRRQQPRLTQGAGGHGTLVATERHHFSVTTGTGINGAEVRVYRIYVTEDEALARRHIWLGEITLDLGPDAIVTGHRFMVPVHGRRLFGDPAAARAWALERGYLDHWYRRAWCPEHGCLHVERGRPCPPVLQPRPFRTDAWARALPARCTESLR